MKETGVVLARVECTIESELCEKFQISGYPTITYFNKGLIVQYHGERTEIALTDYIRGILSPEEIPSEVLLLTTKNFEDVIKGNSVVMVKFYAPWCGHCQHFAPAYAEAARLLHGSSIVLAKLDCSEDVAICSALDILGYPTVRVFRGGKEAEDYGGARKAEAIYEYFMEAEKSTSKVTKITKDSMDKFIAEGVRAVMFGAPWCAHTKELLPEYEKAAAEINDSSVKLGKVDCTLETELCSKYQVRGYPTVLVFKDGEKKEYNGARKSDKICSFLKRMLLPIVSKVETDQVTKFSTIDKIVVLGFYNENKHKNEHAVFQTLARDYHEQAIFGYADAQSPSITIYKQFDGGEIKFDEEFKAEKVKRFIENNIYPVLDEITPQNFAFYSSSELPLAYLFLDKGQEKLIDQILPAAQEFKGKVKFVWIDANKFSSYASNVNLVEKWPAFAILYSKQNLKYPLDQDKAVTADSVREWTKEVLKGRAKPDVKSEPVPEYDNVGLVKIVVGSNFNEIVLDKEKDVFVEFYTPWCVRCKQLAPVYEQLARKYAPSDKILITRMDAANNDIPPGLGLSVTTYPTIKLFTSKSNKIIDFEGDRTLDGFIHFIGKHSVHKVPVINTMGRMVPNHDEL